MKVAIGSLATVAAHVTMAAAQMSASKIFPTGYIGNLTTRTSTSYTTSTVYTTLVHTITSCDIPAVTYCPEKGSVVTETVSLYTTVCPVTTTTPVSSIASVTTPTPVPFTTSTVTTTIMYTITDCSTNQKDCPKVGLETSTVSTYTTVCPVAKATSTVKALSAPYPIIDVEDTIIKPYSTGVPKFYPIPPTGHVTMPSSPRISTVSGGIMHRSDVVLMTVSLAAAAAVAFLESLW
ncbi:hypothetical protein K3495_g9646 [Podosphaera aphanis]|nr:hypothetical protein K3495_g9646 [Podosphaera aphanis]